MGKKTLRLSSSYGDKELILYNQYIEVPDWIKKDYDWRGLKTKLGFKPEQKLFSRDANSLLMACGEGLTLRNVGDFYKLTRSMKVEMKYNMEEKYNFGEKPNELGFRAFPSGISADVNTTVKYRHYFTFDNNRDCYEVLEVSRHMIMDKTSFCYEKLLKGELLLTEPEFDEIGYLYWQVKKEGWTLNGK